MSPPRKRRRAFVALALGLGALVALVTVEAILWIAAPIPHPYASVMPQVNQNHLVYPGRWKMLPGSELAVPTVPGTSGGLIKINRLGFRGDDIVSPRADEIRIMALGGSTTFCAAQADGKAWPALVRGQVAERGTPVRLLNAGYPGQLLRRHMIAATQLIPVVKPTYVTVLAGINDAVYGIDPKRNPPLRLGTANAPIAPRPTTSLKLLLGDLQLFRRIARARGLGRQEGLASATASTRSLPVEAAEPVLDLAGYRRELELLCHYVKAFGGRPVLITQPALYLSKLTDAEVEAHCWMNGNGETRWPRAVLRRSLEAHNAVTREVAQAEGVILVDAAAAFENDLTDMFDDCHFTDAGCAKLAKLVSTALLNAAK